jgi:hypothetical protein
MTVYRRTARVSDNEKEHGLFGLALTKHTVDLFAVS